jgi:predicted transcriptional regulator of viral defense system
MSRLLTPELLATAGLGAYFRPRDVEPIGISFLQLQALVAAGAVEQVDAGLYRLVDVDSSEFETVAMVSAAAPTAIVCLLSALQVHNIGTQAPHEVWLAIDRKARVPRRLPARARFVHWSGVMLTYGVTTTPILGVPVRITSPARTIVDCFRYRNKIGLDVALEALRDGVRTRRVHIADIDRAAEVCRMRTVMAPYLEALTV